MYMNSLRPDRSADSSRSCCRQGSARSCLRRSLSLYCWLSRFEGRMSLQALRVCRDYISALSCFHGCRRSLSCRIRRIQVPAYGTPRSHICSGRSRTARSHTMSRSGRAPSPAPVDSRMGKPPLRYRHRLLRRSHCSMRNIRFFR